MYEGGSLGPGGWITAAPCFACRSASPPSDADIRVFTVPGSGCQSRWILLAAAPWAASESGPRNPRRWVDEPRVMGLPTEVQNLIIHTYAAQTNRSFFLGRAPYPPTLENTPNDLVLREQALPKDEIWQGAVKRAGLFFGLAVAESLNAANVAKLKEQLEEKARSALPQVQDYAKHLTERWQNFGHPDTESDRLKTARGLVNLLLAMTVADADIITVLAETKAETSDTAYGQTIGKANVLVEALKTEGWGLFSAVRSLQDERRKEAEAMGQRIAEILAADEHAIALKPALVEQKAKALRLLTKAPILPPPPPPPPPGIKIIQKSEKIDLPPAEAKAALQKIAAEVEQDKDYRLSITWKITKSINQ